MVTVKLNDKPYRIASTWADVDPDKLLTCETSKDELKALSNIPPDLIDACTDLQLFPLYTIISFIHEAELLPYLEALIVEKEQYRRFESAKIAMREGKPYRRVIAAAKVFYPNEKNSVRLVGLGLSIVYQIATFLEVYQDMINEPPGKNEVEAGIEELTRFSYWGTAYVLAGRDLLKVDDILARPAYEVYTALHYSFKESKYNKRKFELDNPPKTPK